MFVHQYKRVFSKDWKGKFDKAIETWYRFVAIIISMKNNVYKPNPKDPIFNKTKY